MRIRDFRPDDAPALTDLYRRSVEAIGPSGYEPAQVAAWAARAPAPERFQAMMADGRVRLLAVDAGDTPLAFADLEPDGHVDFLYCAPEAARTGVAEILYAALERAAVERGIARLRSEASEAARRFFVKRGFKVLGIRRFEIEGVPIHNYAVEKELDAPSPSVPIRRVPPPAGA